MDNTVLFYCSYKPDRDTSPAKSARSSSITNNESTVHEKNIRQIHSQPVLCSAVLPSILRKSVQKAIYQQATKFLGLSKDDSCTSFY